MRVKIFDSEPDSVTCVLDIAVVGLVPRVYEYLVIV